MSRLEQNKRLADLLFYLALSLIFCHELDAVAHAEWRLLPGLSLLSDEAGRLWFILLHIPLFLLIFWLATHHVARIRERSRAVIDVLLVVHAVAHFTLSGHEHYSFTAPLETITVYGSALVGLAHLLVVRLFTPRTPPDA